MLYFAGSLLFALALIAALAVIATQFLHYRKPMMAALRGLRLESVHRSMPPGLAARAAGSMLRGRPAAQARALPA